MDFTLEKYGQIIDAAQSSNYQLMSLGHWFSKELDSAKNIKDVFLIRHDVDRHPERALDMARLEAEKGVVSSYYFRSVPCSFVPDVIMQIAALGHEIGYHYEDWYTAKYDQAKALELYKKHLAELREIAPVSTIAMHGSPLARDSNLEIWKHHDLCEAGVKDVIESANFGKYAFFTDTGRTFGQSKANLRDFVGSETVFEDVESSDDLIAFLKSKRHPLVYFSVHPERWTDQKFGWYQQMAKDKAVNAIKLGLRMVRGLKSK